MEIKKMLGQIAPYANNKVRDGSGAAEGPRSKSSDKSESASGSDKVFLSDEARLRGAAFRTASEAPDVRVERIRELKERVQNGTYQPDIRKTAQNLVRDDLDLIM